MGKKIIASWIIGCAGIAFLVVMSGGAGKIPAFIDLPGFMIAALLPFATALALFGTGKTGTAFSAPFKQAALKSELETSAAFFRTLMGFIAAYSTLAFTVGFVMIMIYAADGASTGQIGVNLAIAILSFFYASVCAIIVVLPLSAAARIRLSECRAEEAGA